MTWTYNHFFRFFSISCLFLFSNVQAQEGLSKFIVAGYNFSSLELESEKLRPIASPFLGINARIKVKGNLFLRPGIYLSRKRSLINSSSDLRQETGSFGIQIQQRVDDFFFHLGIQKDKNLGRSIIYKTANPQLYCLNENKRDGNNLLLDIGTEFKLNESWNFSFDIQTPLDKSNSGTIQIGLVFKLANDEAELKMKPISERRIRNNHAKRQIGELNNGVLLCRLQTSIPKIEAMIKCGFIEEANEVEEAQRKFNLGLMKSFRKNYSFSQVEFFYSYHSDKVRKGDFNNIFLNEDLQVDSTIEIDTNKKVFTIAYQNIKSDTIQIFDQQVRSYRGGLIDSYFGGPDFSFNALVVMTQDFQQLLRPFPYYTRGFAPSFKQHKTMRVLLFPFLSKDKYDFDHTISIFNSKLIRFKLKTDKESSFWNVFYAW